MQELDQQRRMRMSREGTKPPTLRTSSIQELEGDNVLDPETGQMIPDFLEDGSPNPAAGPTATIKSMRPFDHAWRLLKAPIDYGGFSDIPASPEEMKSGANTVQYPQGPVTTGNQETRDFHKYLQSLGMSPDFPWSNEGAEANQKWTQAVDEFNRQRGNETPTRY